MAPKWTPAEDSALLLALVQVMAPDGPSKSQFEAAHKALDNSFTYGALSQHYNKVLRKKTPVELLAAAKTGEAVAASTPARTTPAKKRKAASITPKTVVDEDEEDDDDDDDNLDDADFLLAATAGKGKKRSAATPASTPKFPNLNKKAKVEEADEGEDEGDDEDDGEDEE